MHALIIDDDSFNLGVLSQMLNMEGVSSSGVINPVALDDALVDSTPIDLVFLDLEMPGIDGLEVFRNLKADNRFQRVPIIAYSVHISEINKVRQLGFQGFIGKPIDADKFPNQLHRILKGEPVWSR
jgi:two-component system cell cycle response regulator DivK